MMKSFILSVCLLLAGVLPSFGQSKFYDLDYEVFEVDGLYYLVSDTVLVPSVGDYFPEFSNIDKFKDWPFFEHVYYNHSLITVFTDGEAWLIPPYYANQIAGIGGDKSYHGELVVPSEVTHDGKTYKVGLAKNFMAESKTDTEHLYSVVFSDGLEYTLDGFGNLYWSVDRPSYVKTITLGENCKYNNFGLDVQLFYFKNLESVYVSENNTQLFDIDGVLCSRPTEDKAGIVLFIPTCGKKVVEVPEREDLRILGNNAISSFYNTHLDRINIPATIDSLDCMAIPSDVDSIYVYATTPPKSRCDIYVSDDAKLFVPHGCVEAYANDEKWGSAFKQIIDMDAETPAAPAVSQGGYIYAEPVTLEAGGEGEIVLKMDLDTDEEVLAWSFKLYLPEGIELATQGFTLSDGLFDDREVAQECFNFTEKKDNSFLVKWLCIYMLQRRPMISTHGELLRIAVHSTLDKAVNVKPELTDICIDNKRDEPLVVNDEMVPRNNTLYVEDFSVVVGTERTLSVKLRNSVDVEGFAFDLILPIGMTVVTDDDGFLEVNLSEERINTRRIDTFEAVRLGTNGVRVLASSSSGTTISPGYGEVCTVRVRINKDIEICDNPLWGPGITQLQLRNISVSDSETNSYDVPFTVAMINFKSATLGDANSDGNITVADLTAIAHHVMGMAHDSFSMDGADANRDGQVNVADYTAVAHLLLYGNIEGPAAARAASAPMATDVTELDNTVYIEPVKAGTGEELTLPVKMKNAVEAEGFQFSLYLPAGVSVVCDADGLPLVSLSDERTTARRTNTFQAAMQDDGSLRVMAASTNASTFSGTDGEVCTVRVKLSADIAKGDYALLLRNVAISDTHAQSHDVAEVEATLTVSEASGIEEIANAEKAGKGRLYDLQGRRAQNSKGLLLRDGRKFISK